MPEIQTLHLPALAFALAALLVAAFQLALAAGLPWGGVAMAGRYPGRYPPAMRVVSMVLALSWLFLAAVVWVRAGLLWPQWQDAVRPWAWVIVGYCGLGLLMNLITPVKLERLIWGPVAALMTVSAAWVAWT